MSIETRIADHYTTGALTTRILAALESAGVDPENPAVDDLNPVGEFHTGGVEATRHLLDQLPITAATRVLDLGSGIGGTSRYVASRYGCDVSGIDLTPAFIDTARDLSARVGLSALTNFTQGSILALPHDADSFDLAVMLHVGMNIEDKLRLMQEAARVLRPGGQFAVFDVMGGPRPAPLVFPLPWSSRSETSFVATPDEYRAAAEDAGLDTISSRDRTEFAKTFFQKVFARIANEGVPPLGIHLLMGETAGEKLSNYVVNLESGRIAPTEMIFRKPG